MMEPPRYTISALPLLGILLAPLIGGGHTTLPPFWNSKKVKVSFVPASGLAQPPAVSYTVRVASVEEKLFEVEMKIAGLKAKSVELSLPAWTPGYYTIENFARFVRKFQATGPDGKSLRVSKLDKDTWRIALNGTHEVTARLQYRADSLDLNQSYITPDWAYFNGTSLFPFVDGRYDLPARVRLELPEGWRVVTGLRPTGEPNVFTAPNYDYLVDCPTLLGHFDLDSLSVAGRWVRVAIVPQGIFADSTKKVEFLSMIEKVVRVENEIMGGPPYEDYTFLYFLMPSGRGGLEHQNSTVILLHQLVAQNPRQALEVTAHEFFHLWNVKRIRPAELWPYDYTREQHTPSLWVSEGITSYYTDLALVRSGLITTEEFYRSLANSIGGLQENDAHRWVSVAEASINTWIEPGFSISYYTKGSLLGLLLDLALRYQTRNTRSLDDVMRTLLRDYYGRGRGFTQADLRRELEQACACELDQFFAEYVNGMAELDYPRYLAHAGLALKDSSIAEPFMGVGVEMGPDSLPRVNFLVPGGPATRAGIRVGDVLLKVGDFEPRGQDFGPAFRAHFNARLGEKTTITLRRGRDPLELPFEIGKRERREYRVEELPTADPLALKVRQGLLTGR